MPDTDVIIQIILAVLVGAAMLSILLFFLVRRFILWYFRIDDQIRLLEKIAGVTAEQLRVAEETRDTVVPARPVADAKRPHGEEWECPSCSKLNAGNSFKCDSCGYSLV